MMSCHLISTWQKSNVNADDVMMSWFTLYVNLVTSHLTCMIMHGACAQYKYCASKYLSVLACMQAGSNLEKRTFPLFGVLSAQNANENIPNMIPIAYLSESFMDCNENFALGK